MSASTSPRCTGSPSCLCQVDRTPSFMVSDRRGMSTSGMGGLRCCEVRAGEGVPDGAGQCGGVGQGGQFQWFGVGQRNFGGGHPPDGGIQVVEGSFLDGGGDFGADAVGQPVVLQHDRAAGSAYRGTDRVPVQRPQAAQVDDLDGDAVVFQAPGYAQGDHGGAGVGDDGDVGAGFGDGGGADLDGVVAVGDLALGVVQGEVFQQQHRVVVADRCGEQALGVGRGRGGEHLQAGYVGVEDLQVL